EAGEAVTVNLDVFQRTHFTWASENFGDHPWWHPVLGVIEELGEASRDMGDRDKFLDAASDAMIYATDACTCMGRKLSSLWHESFEVEPKSGRVLSEIQGALAHHVLKSIQGIRGSQSQHQAHVWMYLCQMTRWLR